ncbi:MAG: glycoside hydrolase family 76 protein, partial [Muribaculaceae bacterium]|nr:glycoside hydrolase family 76 protein [Muribaculaceae bacterium]
WSGNPDLINRGYNYWWMAHAVDAYVDAYARMGNRLYQSRAFQIKEGMYTAYNGGRQDLFNDYNDDMEWMCIACCHAYGSFTADKSKWLAEAVQLFDWIWQSWDESTGGILWTVGSQRGVLSSKNSCSNAPAMICANYLYEITGDESYLQKSKMIFDFMSEHSLFDDGFVKDGPENDNRGWAFTYNQGTWIGGLMGLYKATGEQKYYDIAVDLIDKSIDSRWYSPNGILCESGKGDGGLFKGIYIRYITEWVLSGLLDENRKMRYANYLLENARSLYLSALIKPDFTIMANWQDRGESSLETYDSSVVLSGLFLLEGVDKLRRAGILTDNYTLNNPSHGKPFRHYRLNVTANYGGNKVDINSFSLLGEHAGSGVTDITMPETDAGYEVYNLTGNKVGKNITNLVPGIYVIKSSITTSKKVIR